VRVDENKASSSSLTPFRHSERENPNKSELMLDFVIPKITVTNSLPFAMCIDLKIMVLFVDLMDLDNCTQN